MGDRIKVIMDCDPGIDDGIALAYAAAHQDELELLAITTFAGNATIDKVTKNALELVDFYGLKVPVARGFMQKNSTGKQDWDIAYFRKQERRLHQTMQYFLSERYWMIFRKDSR